jgi:hypothetical protein
MKLQDLLYREKPNILRRWFDLIIDTYPHDTSGFFKSNRDRFANPVGQTLLGEIEVIYDLFLGEAGDEELALPLERIVKIRAVQDFSPSEGIEFVFLLKKAVRERLEGGLADGGLTGELTALESRIDRMALLSFDIYMGCVRKLYELRADELRRKMHMLVRRANASV